MSTWAAVDIATVATGMGIVLSVVGALSGVASWIRTKRESSRVAGRNEVDLLFDQQNEIIRRQAVDIQNLTQRVQDLEGVHADNLRLSALLSLREAENLRLVAEVRVLTEQIARGV